MKPVEHAKNEPEVISRITDLLIEQGKTQKELVESLGLHKNNFTEWKSGRKRSYLLYIDEIAKYLNVSPTYLLRGPPEIDEVQIVLHEIMKGFNSSQKAKVIEAACIIRNQI
jgi:transcriptional regulator with XRE-family HTH domain